MSRQILSEEGQTIKQDSTYTIYIDVCCIRNGSISAQALTNDTNRTNNKAELRAGIMAGENKSIIWRTS